jgi:hypothetical protein
LGIITRKVEFRELEATGFGVGARGTSGNLVVPRAETPISPSEENRGKKASKTSSIKEIKPSIPLVVYLLTGVSSLLLSGTVIDGNGTLLQPVQY